jgi:hypothetical protein
MTSKAVLICAWLTVLLIIGCERETAPTQSGSAKREQELPLTFGGFLKGSPEDERLDGVCGPDPSRNVVECDIYNGLPGWRITEITIKVVILPSFKERPSASNNWDAKQYRVPVEIRPMMAEHIAVRLGLRIPPDEYSARGKGKGPVNLERWSWQLTGAKGYSIH